MGLTPCDTVRVGAGKEEEKSLRLDSQLLDIVVRYLTAGGRELHDVLRNDPDYRDWLSVANPELFSDLYE